MFLSLNTIYIVTFRVQNGVTLPVGASKHDHCDSVEDVLQKCYLAGAFILHLVVFPTVSSDAPMY